MWLAWGGQQEIDDARFVVCLCGWPAVKLHISIHLRLKSSVSIDPP